MSYIAVNAPWNEGIRTALEAGGYLEAEKNPNIPDIFRLLVSLANVAIVVGLGISFIALAVSFVSMLSAAGDPKLAEKAKNGITWSILAMIVCAFSFVIQRIALYLIGAGTTAE